MTFDGFTKFYELLGDGYFLPVKFRPGGYITQRAVLQPWVILPDGITALAVNNIQREIISPWQKCHFYRPLGVIIALWVLFIY